jgi:hypothetical protein
LIRWRRRVERAVRMPPRALASWILNHLRRRAERILAPRRGRQFNGRTLLAQTSAHDLAELWEELRNRPYPALTSAPDGDYDELCPGDRARILQLAERAIQRTVDVLGSGPTNLGRPACWNRDPKTGHAWPDGFAGRIDYADLGRPSDVKLPWEISRMQWLLPAGQAYLLTGDERYAAAAKELLEEWIAANRYAQSVNWCVAMEAALRIMSWTWLFQVLSGSASWSDPGFRTRFLTALYLHADFVERNLERGDVNGNHYTADAAGLVFAGLFFGRGRRSERWSRVGWQILTDELPRQVFADGVDFEASTAYHRLVTELFLLPALYRERLGLDVPSSYRDRVIAMARFAATYSRPDGTTPLWGDADDARALPLGGQSLNDHRYLAGLVGASWGIDELSERFTGPRAEVLWLLGSAAARKLPSDAEPPAESLAFPNGGFYVMRTERDHVFIDCGPVGLAGRGGHGHNDCLSFEAVLDGVHLVSDCGSYAYTGSAAWREQFRSTAFHNTPVVDGHEQNRPASPASLWQLTYDAIPEVELWETSPLLDRFRGGHAGFQRLAHPVTLVRTIELERGAHRLTVHDDFGGGERHRICVPFHLAVGVVAGEQEPGRWSLDANGRRFLFTVSPGRWHVRLKPAWISRSYGVKEPSSCLELTLEGMPQPLTVVIEPSPETRER